MKILIPLLHSKTGALAQWVTGIAIGFISSKAVALGITLSPEALSQLEIALSAGGAFAVSAATQWYQARNAVAVQTALGVTPDAWIGKKTVSKAKATRELIESSASKDK